MDNQMPTREILEADQELEKAKLEYREAMSRFTSAADKLSRLLLDQPDYMAYIIRREPLPEWVREVSSRQWMFKAKTKLKPKTQEGYREKKQKKRKAIDTAFNNLMGGFK